MWEYLTQAVEKNVQFEPKCRFLSLFINTRDSYIRSFVLLNVQTMDKWVGGPVKERQSSLAPLLRLTAVCLDRSSPELVHSLAPDEFTRQDVQLPAVHPPDISLFSTSISSVPHHKLPPPPLVCIHRFLPLVALSLMVAPDRGDAD